jgi:23S rRNA (guanosine2251-2'-O)-methyltransferase
MNIKEEEKREGFHVVDALLKHSPEIIKKIFIPDSRNDQRLSSLVSVAESLSIDVEVNKKTKQHPIAKIIPQPTLGNKDLKKFIESSATKNPTLFIVDNIIDPRNLGACIRSAVAANVDAIIINKHQCSPITSAVRKVSCGGTEVGNIFMVSNVINVIKFLKDQGIEIIGTSEHSADIYTSMDFNTPLALIVGSEETGIRQKTLDACNYVVNLSDSELINSLNVSVASGVVLFEIKKHKSSL